MGLDSIVNVQISRQTAGITQAGFGTALILGPNAGFTGEVREYTSLSAVAEDFETSDAEYTKARALFAQTPRVQKIKIGKTSTPVAQVETLTPVVAVQSAHHYITTIDGVAYDFLSDSSPTAGEVVTGVNALINADSACKMAATGTTTTILTSKNAGAPSTVSVNSFFTQVHTMASHGIADDIQAAIDLDPDWYFLLTTASDDTTVTVAASVIEAMRRQYGFLNSDSDVRTSATDDIISVLKAKSLFRTFVIYSGTPADQADAALVGRIAPLPPGSETAANKTLAGVTVDKWTDAELAHLVAKRASHYITIAGVNITQGGMVLGGEWIDVIRFIDWVTARMGESVLLAIITPDKLPLTNAGLASIELAMRKVLKQGVRAGGIPTDNDFTVTVPDISEIPAQDKAARKLVAPNCPKFTAVMAQAIHATDISGVVTN